MLPQSPFDIRISTRFQPDGRPKMTRRRGDARWWVSRLSRPAGAQHFPVGLSGGSSALHHRLVSCVPPARSGGGPALLALVGADAGRL